MMVWIAKVGRMCLKRSCAECPWLNIGGYCSTTKLRLSRAVARLRGNIGGWKCIVIIKENSHTLIIYKWSLQLPLHTANNTLAPRYRKISTLCFQPSIATQYTLPLCIFSVLRIHVFKHLITRFCFSGDCAGVACGPLGRLPPSSRTSLPVLQLAGTRSGGHCQSGGWKIKCRRTHINCRVDIAHRRLLLYFVSTHTHTHTH
jgi:hypothetical protein